MNTYGMEIRKMARDHDKVSISLNKTRIEEVKLRGNMPSKVINKWLGRVFTAVERAKPSVESMFTDSELEDLIGLWTQYAELGSNPELIPSVLETMVKSSTPRVSKNLLPKLQELSEIQVLALIDILDIAKFRMEKNKEASVV